MDEGVVDMIVRRPGAGRREVADVARLDVELGLVGDDWLARGSRYSPNGAADPDKQVTLMNSRVVDALSGGDRAGWPLAGDQLYVDLDLQANHLPSETCLAVGTAVVQVTAAPHRGCAKFAATYGVDALRWVNTGIGAERRFRGVNARVVRGGWVTTGDRVRRAGAWAVGP